jgi:CRP-like cAMP-binding protein
VRSKNHVLNVCAEADFALIKPHLEHVTLRRHQSVELPDAVIEYVYFPETCILSLLAPGPDGAELEAGIIGREGLSACSVLHGTDRSPLHTKVQIPGEAMRMDVGAFRKVLAASPSLRFTLLKVSQAKFIQVAFTARSNGHDKIEQRLARWILMCRDRLDGDEMPITHEFLAAMLGVCRAGITTAMHVLEGIRGIRATRGQIAIRDREVLEKFAGDAYGLAEKEYARLLGPFQTDEIFAN